MAISNVMIKGKQFCLTHLGFSLKVAFLVMKFIIEAMQSQEESAGRMILTYIDDVYVNENIMFAEHVRAKLAEYRLMCKVPEHLKNGTCMLGTEVCRECNSL